MWNQLWGQMSWGTAVVPGPGAGALLGVALAMLLVGWWATRRRAVRPLAALLLVSGLAVPIAVYATVTLPYTFSNGSVADADEVNANFAALVAAVEANQDRLDEIGQMFLTTDACPAGHTAVEDGYIRLGGAGLTIVPTARTLATPGHQHAVGSLSVDVDGSHTHTFNDYHYRDTGFDPNYATPTGDDTGIRSSTLHSTNSSPAHSHGLSGSVGTGAASGDADLTATGQLEHVLLRLCAKPAP
ncbi:MAG: hypothetical protein ACQGVC_14625 [Myxococcota bacterium]